MQGHGGFRSRGYTDQYMYVYTVFLSYRVAHIYIYNVYICTCLCSNYYMILLHGSSSYYDMYIYLYGQYIV